MTDAPAACARLNATEVAVWGSLVSFATWKEVILLPCTSAVTTLMIRSTPAAWGPAPRTSYRTVTTLPETSVPVTVGREPLIRRSISGAIADLPTHRGAPDTPTHRPTPTKTTSSPDSTRAAVASPLPLASKNYRTKAVNRFSRWARQKAARH